MNEIEGELVHNPSELVHDQLYLLHVALVVFWEALWTDRKKASTTAAVITDVAVFVGPQNGADLVVYGLLHL